MTPDLDHTSAPLDSWQREIGSVVDELRALSAGSEEEFLTVGEAFQGVYGRSLELTSRCGEMLQLVSGEEISLVVRQLEVMLEDMDRYVTLAGTRNMKGRESLGREREILCRVVPPLEGFARLNKTLRMLSISTKIESARLGGAGAGFVNLAMDVERLSREVYDKSEAIRREISRLLVMIDQSLATIGSDTDVQQRGIGRLMETIRSNLSSLHDLHRRFLGAGETVTKVSDEVSSSMGEVVAALQFHDITRQQLEHVIEALENVRSRIDCRQCQHGGQETELVVETGDVCELQHAQMRHSVDEFCSAVAGIRSILSDIASRLDFMVNELHGVVGMPDDESGVTPVDDIMAGMREATVFLLECRRLDREMEDTLHQVFETVSHISKFVSEIRGIGNEIDLIALNSQVRAVHAGSEGAALAVLAEAIKRLSDEAVQQTTEVSHLLTEVVRCTTLLDDHRSDREGETFIEDAEHRIDEALARLRGLDARIVSSLREVADGVHALDAEISDVTGRFRIDVKVREGTEPILALLRRVVHESRALHPASERFLDNLRFMEKKYTMESERRIHEELIRKRQKSTSPVRETAAVSAPGASVGGGEFGDNVELF